MDAPKDIPLPTLRDTLKPPVRPKPVTVDGAKSGGHFRGADLASVTQKLRQRMGQEPTPGDVLQALGQKIPGTEQRPVKKESLQGARFAESEKKYISGHQKKADLERRYEDPGASREAITRQVQEFAQSRGVNVDSVPVDDLEKGKLDQAVDRVVERFFNSEKGSKNKEKLRLVKEQTSQYLSLLKQVAKEGTPLTTADMYRLAAENVAIVAYQDRAASENLIGDHGVRHLVGHNIKVSMEIADQLAARGVVMTAKDRLILHQIMMYHDLGYAMSPVRDAINAEGVKGQDAGHNVLAAKYVRERYGDASDVWHKVFDESDFALIHKGVLYHDKDASGKASIGFNMQKEFATPGERQEARRQNIESITRLADSTDAFERKLPELLYAFPESIKLLRLMRTAGELNSEAAREVIPKLKMKLASEIRRNKEISADDKEALLMALLGKPGTANQGVTIDSYKFTVDRICGNKPTYRVDEKGKLRITVEISDIHQEVIGLFGREAYKQFQKFVEDVFGHQVDGNSPDQIVSPQGHIIEKRGSERKSDYQQRLQELVFKDKRFREFVLTDDVYRKQADALNLERQQMQRGELPNTEADVLKWKLKQVKVEHSRLTALNSYMNTYG